MVLSLKQKRSARKENKVVAEEMSGFINMYSNANVDSNNQSDFKVRLEGSLTLQDMVLESDIDFNNNQWDVGETTLTYDRPDKLHRFILGNISTGSRNFQENIEIIGLKASKEFFLNPDVQIQPNANESFILKTNSEVEVFTNNLLLQRLYLQKGVYKLKDIGLNNGENNIRIRITDSFGKVTIKSSQQYYDSHLLKPGLSPHSWSIGYLDRKNRYSDLEKTPLISAYYEKGITKSFTASIDSQISSDNYLLGGML